MSKTKIQWATDVWNPTVGCTKVSAGCKNCYAERIYERFHPGQNFSTVRMIPEKLDDPLHWEKPRRIFVDSMSDLFHEDISDDFIAEVWDIMLSTPWHTYMILTKRPIRMLNIARHPYKGFFAKEHNDLPNVWLGVSVEDQKTADKRIPLLLQAPAAVRFVSVEPMLGKIDLQKATWFDNPYESKHDLPPNGIGLGCVICGCESGPGARPMDLDWARSLRDQCQTAGVPFFLKQANIDGKLTKMPALDGKIWDKIPENR